MILIADSGGTKTDWLLSSGEVIKTSGLHPYFLDAEGMRKVISKELTPQLNENIDKIFFYGAGCLLQEKKNIVLDALQHFFPDIPIEVESDLLGTARALFKNDEGIACILGTGSSSCLYNGKKIIDQAPSLGYLIGDEGSGADIGKRLIKSYFEKQLSSALNLSFEERFNIDKDHLLREIYHHSFPNRHFAAFAAFAYENKKDENIKRLIYNSLEAFIKNQKSYYNTEQYNYSFCGSVSFFFKDILQEVLITHGITVGKIIQSPMQGLMQYH